MRLHKSIWACSASALAVLAAAPAFAADANSGTSVDEVVVTGIRASLQASIETKRNSTEIVEAITAEDVGKFPDKNVAESLQRITGVAIQREFGEGERVSIRGTAPVLNMTLLNGHPIATADWFILDQLKASRSFNYLMLPSEIVGKIEVYKSPSADLNEGGIGGTVDVHTRLPLDLAPITVQASAQGVYDSIAGDVDPSGSALLSWHNDNSTLGALVGLIYSKRSFRRDGIEILGYSDYRTTKDPVTGVVTGGIKDLDTGQRFDATVPNLIGSTLFRQVRERTGANFAVQFAPDNTLTATLSGLYSHMDADNFNLNYMSWPQQMLSADSGVHNPVLRAPTDGEALPTLESADFDKTTGANGAVYDAIDRLAHTDTKAIDFDVTYRPNENWKLHGQIGYTKANGATDAQPFWETNAPTGFSYDLSHGVPRVHFTDIDPNTADSALALGWTSNNKVENSDDEFYAYADAERFFNGELGPFTSIKVGGKYSSHNRNVNVTYGQTRGLFGATACNGHPCTLADVAGGRTPDNFLDGIAGPGVLNSYLMADKSKIEAIYNSLPPFAQYGMPAEGQTPGCPDLSNCQHFGPLESFDLNEKTFGGYVQGNFGGEGWGGNIGVRVITTKETSDAWQVGVASGTPGAVQNPFGLIAPISFDKEYTDILPSANLHFDLKDDLVLRFAASRTVARPDYAQMAAFTSITPTLLTGSGGNPHIDPYRSNNFDVSFEWYFAPQSIFAVDFFYKDISTYIVQGSGIERLPAEILSPTDPRITNPANNCVLSGTASTYICDYRIGRPVNVTGGEDKGIEVNFQKPLWGGFGIQANYTYQQASSQSGVPIPGFSRHLANVTGYYENDRLSVRLSGNYRSKYFADYDSERGFRPLYVDDTFSLDGSASFNLTDNFALTVDAVNLTNETLEEFYDDDPGRPARFYKNGRVVYFGVRAKF